jgi:hypothetical protein
VHRLVAPLLVLTLLAVLTGCGSSGETTGGAQPQIVHSPPPGASVRACKEGDAAVEGLRASGVTCTEARHVMLGWRASAPCKPPAGASRSGCPALSYRCLATATERGWSVSCAKPGRSIAFRVRD